MMPTRGFCVIMFSFFSFKNKSHICGYTFRESYDFPVRNRFTLYREKTDSNRCCSALHKSQQDSLNNNQLKANVISPLYIEYTHKRRHLNVIPSMYDPPQTRRCRFLHHISPSLSFDKYNTEKKASQRRYVCP